MLNQCFLHLGLTDPLLHILPGARIHANPQTFGGAALDLHPDERIRWNKFAAGPAEKHPKDRHATQSPE